MKTCNFVLIVSVFLSLFSCKNKSEAKEASVGSSTNLPNYGNVDLASVFTKADNQLSNKQSLVGYIDQYYKKVWDGSDLSGGILVAKGDEILYENYRGFGREGNQMPIDKNTPLHVASVSKTLTAMAMMKLVEAGKIKLSDPLSQYFPGFPYPNVTVQTLLDQRSGLPKYEYFITKIQPAPAELSKQFVTNQDILNMIIKYKPDLARDTDTGFMYCNTNFAMLALLIEKVTKTPFPQAMKEMVFTPLKMNNTYIFQEKDIPTASQSFYYGANKLYPLDRLDLIYGDKNVYTTPRDLYNFSKAMFSKDFLKPELMQMVFTPYSNEKAGMNNYGLGFRMKIFDNGEKLTYHNGWWHGTNSVFAHLLNSKVTIVAIGNKYSNKVYTALALSGLFEDFPLQKDKLHSVMNDNKDTLSTGQEVFGE
ncbi:serine hydrolase [Chryseobacterium lactis]|uniref:Serine hydrolase n=1 Tax=Chryseobacterium lactis TaxID=1241981 RepID=A0A3G6RS36_CHRLC|nr:serine hydrolase domain-containing protein [Chryseobacterium lactis]AZA81078.1 class A beta-lactamase-related serine hydrolase [Chryseobacterium lactis]AZB06079.1 class A beta-lactamase-related serine hydrolase [Chryseobacterium lactis]PNW14929.1 serine hydrolase [Chryseobacterium lactis]